MTTLMGGTDLVVTKRDGSTETVKVLQLGIEKYPELLQSMDDEIASINLYCGRSSTGFATSLTLQSQEAVIEAGEKVNSDFFKRWIDRRMARTERLQPGLLEKINAALVQSSTSLPKQP